MAMYAYAVLLRYSTSLSRHLTKHAARQAISLAAPSPFSSAAYATVLTINIRIRMRVRINEPKHNEPIFLQYANLNPVLTLADPSFSALESK